MTTLIDKIHIHFVRAPLAKPVSAFGMNFTFRDYIFTEIFCSDGGKGLGFSYVGVGGGEAAALACEDLLAPLLLGQNPHHIKSLWDKMMNATLIQSRAGIVMNAMSALDIALWDYNARAKNMSLCTYLGGDIKTKLPVYASGGYYAEDKDLDGFKAEMHSWKEAGYKAVKIKTGKLSILEEEKRVAALRDILGTECFMMLDLYNAMQSVEMAMQYMNMYKNYNPYWIEDPFKPDDIGAFIRLSKLITIPMATGEFHYSPYLFEHLLETGATSTLQAEAPRCGGITQWLRIADMAYAKSASMNPCWFHQIHAQILPSISNRGFVEHFPDESVLNFDSLISPAPVTIHNGEASLRDTIGIGFDIDPKTWKNVTHKEIIVE